MAESSTTDGVVVAGDVSAVAAGQRQSPGAQFWSEVGQERVLNLAGGLGGKLLEDTSASMAFLLSSEVERANVGVNKLDTKVVTEVVRESLLGFFDHYSTDVAAVTKEGDGWKIVDPNRQEGVGLFEGMLKGLSQDRTLGKQNGDKGAAKAKVDRLFEEVSLGNLSPSRGEQILRAGIEMTAMQMKGEDVPLKEYSSLLRGRDAKLLGEATKFAVGLVSKLGQRTKDPGWWNSKSFSSSVGSN